MEEEGFGKSGSLSSYSSWVSRLSPLAQPFTLKREAIEPESLNSLTIPNPTKHFAPSPRNCLDTFEDSVLLNSFANLINFEEDVLSMPTSASALAYPSHSQAAQQSDYSLSASAFPFDGHKSSAFGSEASLTQIPLESFRGFCDETEFDGFSFDNKSSVSSPHARYTAYQGQGRTEDWKIFVSSSEAIESTRESLIKQDSKITPHNIFSATDVSSLSMSQKATQVTSTTCSTSSAADFTGNSFPSDNHGSFGRKLSGERELCVLPKAYSKEIYQDKSLIYKGEEMKHAKSVSCNGLDPLLIAKSECKVTSDDICDGLILRRPGTIKGLSLESSSKKLDEDEDDLDSPCWKGVQNSGRSAVKVSDSMSFKSLRNEPEAGPSLNPQAPQFFPSNGKGIVDYSQNNLVGDSFPSSFSVAYKEKKLLDPHKASPTAPGFSNATGYRCSSAVQEPREESFMLKKSKTGSALNSPQMVNSSLVDGVFPALDLAMEKMQNFPASENESLNDWSQTLQCLSQSISRSPNIDFSLMIKAIHYLSELLVQNCADDYESMNKNDHDMIQDIIDNLYVFINYRVGQNTSMISLPDTGSLDYHANAATVHKRPNSEFQVTRSKDQVAQHELDSLRHNWVNSYSQASTSKMQDLISSCMGAGSERGNNVNTALRAVLKEKGPMHGDLEPQALLNLWIEAQADLCSVKYENRILRMKLQMNGC